MENTNINEKVLQAREFKVTYTQSQGSKEYDITSITEEANIFEDIWKPFITATVVVACSSSIDQRVGFLSQDFIEFNWEDSLGNPVSFSGIINNVTTVEVHRSHKTIALHAVAVQSTLAYKGKICHAWRNTTVGKILRDVLKTITIDDVVIEETLSNIPIEKYVATNQSPLDVVAYFIKTYGRRHTFHHRMVGGSGKYYIEQMASNSGAEFSRTIHTDKEGKHLSGNNEAAIRSGTLFFDLTARADYMKTLDSPEIASERYIPMHVRKTILKEEYNMNQNPSGATVAWDNSGNVAYRRETGDFKVIPKSTMNTSVSCGYCYDNIKSDQTRYVWKDKIKDDESPLARSSKLVCEFGIPGDNSVELNNRINMEIHNVANREEEDWRDNHLSGAWTVTSIRRQITKGQGFICTIEASRDTLSEDVADITTELESSIQSLLSKLAGTIFGRLLSSLLNR